MPRVFCCMKFIQPKCLFLFYLFVYVVNVCSFHPSPFPTPVSRRSCVLHNAHNYKIELNFANFVQIGLFTFGIIMLLWLSYLHLRNHVRYVCFTTDLSTLTKKNPTTSKRYSLFLSLLMLGLLFELEKDQILFLIIRIIPNIGSLVDLLLDFSKTVSRLIFNVLSLYIFSISISPFACIISLFCIPNLVFFVKQKCTLLVADVAYFNFK